MQYNHYKWSQYPVWTLIQVLDREKALTPAQSFFVSASRPKFELYNLTDDPYETKNLAYLPAYQSKLCELLAALENWIDVADKGIYPEPNYDVLQGLSEMEKSKTRALERIGIQNQSSVEEIDEKYLKYWQQKMNRLF